MIISINTLLNDSLPYPFSSNLPRFPKRSLFLKMVAGAAKLTKNFNFYQIKYSNYFVFVNENLKMKLIFTPIEASEVKQ